MRNRFVKYLPALGVLLLLLTGCGSKPAPQTTGQTESASPAVTEATAQTTAPIETTQPVETEPSTAPEETVGESTVPYLLRIDRADQSLFDGPGYDYVFAGIVRERGTYTIVEERWDQECHLWGRLKSGAGWVDLTQIHSEEYAQALLSANFADENLILHGAYHHHRQHQDDHHDHHNHHNYGSDSCIPIAIRAYGFLRNVELCAFEFVGDDFIMGDAFYRLPEMDGEMPLVAELEFPGDMTMYGIRFTDEDGNIHVYSIYISGRNGSLVLQKEEP